MARPQKPGLDYFPLDVHIADDIELLEVDCGLEGFAILVKLWQKIYCNCYYMEWGDDHEKLFSRKISADVKTVKNVIEHCFDRDLLSREMFDRYSILTSRGIQKRYLKACTDCKRTNITMIKEYLLIKDNELLSSIKTLKSIISDETEVITEETEVITEETNVNTEISTQSKVKENREDNSKELINAFFESVWKLYPEKRKGKSTISDTNKKELYKIGFEEMKRAIERYSKEVYAERDDGFKTKNFKDGSTFFRSHYKDYLDANYEEQAVKEKENINDGISNKKKLFEEWANG